MIWIDYAIIGVIALSTFVSLIRGAVREFFSLVAWVGALLLGVALAATLAPHLTFIPNECMRIFGGFAGVFAICFIVLGIVNMIIVNVLIRPKVGIIDRFIGMIFGAARGVLMVGAVLLMLDVLALMDAEDSKNKVKTWWPGSTLLEASWIDPYNEDSVTSVLRELVKKVVDEEIQGGVCETKVEK